MLRASFKSWAANWPEWGIIILLFLALEIAVRSIEQAKWIKPQPSLTVVLILAVATGWLLGKSRLPSKAIHPIAAVIGAVVIVWQASNLLPTSGIASRVNQLAVALQSWWQTISMAKPSEGTIHFAVFLIFFTWVIGYISTWFLLRRRNAWVAVFLGAITILINLSNLPAQHYTLFFFYVLTALLLIGLTSLANHRQWFKKYDIIYPNRGIVYFTTSLLCLSVLVVSVAWLTPEKRVERLETLIITKTLWSRNIEKYFNNLLAAVPAKQSFLKSEEQRELLFGDSFGEGDELQFVVISDQPYYWRTRMYDVYTSLGWTSSNAMEYTLRKGITVLRDEGTTKCSEITYTVVTKLRTDILITAGDFVSSDIPVSVQTLAPLKFNIDLMNPTHDSSLPPDVASLALSLRTLKAENKEIGPDEFRQLLPEDLTLTGIGATSYSSEEADYTPLPIFDSAQLTTIEVTRVSPGRTDIIALTTPRLLRSDQRYRVTTSVSSATANDLSEADDNYPLWITDYYLQLPSTLPESIRQLSETVTKEAKSPYDKVLAIKQYLSQIKYSAKVKAPPQGADGVDHFLFTEKSGNCVHFASALAAMLRSVGVPSRVCIGYAPGEYDATTRSSILRAKQRHAWSEVYFPGYGWVAFEAIPPADSELGVALNLDIDSMVIGSDDNRMDEEWSDEGGGVIGGFGGSRINTRNQLGIILFFAITGILLLVFILWSILSRRRRHCVRPDYASDIYRKMCFFASLARLGPKPQQTPSEYYARLTSVFPLQAEALGCIVQTYVERQFSRRKELDNWGRGRLRMSWNKVYPVLLKRLFHIRY